MNGLKTMAALAVLLCCTTSCLGVKGSKNYVTKTMKVDNFTTLHISGSPDVTYTQQAGKPKVEVYTSDNILEYLDIYVENGILNVGFKKGLKTNLSYNKLEVRITSETLNDVKVAGSGDFRLMNGLKTDNLNITVAGSGEVEGNGITCSNLGFKVAGSGEISCKDIRCDILGVIVAGSGEMELNDLSANEVGVKIAGSGDVTLNGRTDEATYEIAGSGELKAADLEARRVSATISGSGDIRCHATEHLKARTHGSGSIAYKGDPEIDYPKKGLRKL